jgi:hypothetical protein
MAEIPGEAIDAGVRAAVANWPVVTTRGFVTAILAEAGPLIAAAERKRLADRQQVIGEVKNELDDAFQFTDRDGSRHSYVTRDWVQSLLAHHAASAAATECERIITVARKLDATYPVTLEPEPGSEGSTRRAVFPFADYLADVPVERQGEGR